jgi:arylsulfatase A-like enzyme
VVATEKLDANKPDAGDAQYRALSATFGDKRQEIPIMTMRNFLRGIRAVLMIIGAIAGGYTGLAAAPRALKPNILFIMVDDLGKEWISCYGAEDIETPNIDALAKGGMMFHNAYSMPACTPSRTTLLTGKYAWRTGWTSHWDVPRWGVAYFDWKKKDNTTFARLMKDLGYGTCAAGKWQINDFRIEPQAMKKHGFDDWAMWTGWEEGNEASETRFHDAYVNTPAGSKTYAGKFGPDVYTDHLISFMRTHKDEPMCLYYPMALVHRPWVSTPEEPKAKTRLDKHKAMVRYADKMVGRLVRTLDELEIRDRSIVIFTTDNGSTGGRVGFTGMRNGKAVAGAKGTESEAGVCAPFIVNCPGLVPAGVETDALTDFSDMLPTFMDLGGGEPPENLIIDGTSIAPLILGEKQDSERKWIMALGTGTARLTRSGVSGAHDFQQRVIRDKRYKAWVSTEKTIIRLHDLEKDPWEETNLLDIELPTHIEALQKFQAVVDSLPDQDAHPTYEPRAENPWDKKLRGK